MKKILSLCSTLLLTLSLVACGSTPHTFDKEGLEKFVSSDESYEVYYELKDGYEVVENMGVDFFLQESSSYANVNINTVPGKADTSDFTKEFLQQTFDAYGVNAEVTSLEEETLSGYDAIVAQYTMLTVIGDSEIKQEGKQAYIIGDSFTIIVTITYNEGTDLSLIEPFEAILNQIIIK